MSLHPTQGRRAFRPTLESLEQRVVPVINITEIPDVLNPGFFVLRIVGDNHNHNLTITDNQAGANSIGISENGSGERINVRNQAGTILFSGTNFDGLTATTGLFGGAGANPGPISGFDVKFGLGNDTLTYTIQDWNTATNGGQTRAVSIDLGGGKNAFTLNTGASSTIQNSGLSLSLNGTAGTDTITSTLQAIDNSKVNLSFHKLAGSLNTVTESFTGTINNNSSVSNNITLGGSSDSVSVSVTGTTNASSVATNLDLSSAAASTVTFNDTGTMTAAANVTNNIVGSGGTDNMTVNLGAAQITGNSTFNTTANLGCGTKAFTGTFGAGFNDAAGSSATFNVTGSHGNDNFAVNQTGGTSTIAGLMDIELAGGATGNKVLGNAVSGTLNLTGNYRLRMNGGGSATGHDTLGTTLVNTAGSTGNYDISEVAGPGVDTVSFSLNTNAAAGVTFNPGNQILLDGGPAPAPGNALHLVNPNNAPIVTRNFSRSI